MPELPEVETVCAGLHDLVVGQQIVDVRVYESRLRYPVPMELADVLSGETVVSLRRRAKYLLMDIGPQVVILHLGMSGSLRWVSDGQTPQKHDHVDIVFSGGCLRFHDPRRFGLIVLAPPPVEQHRLLAHLGPEPLSDDFDGQWLFEKSRGRRIAIKSLLMENRVVVGVGNIYANESLFLSGMAPKKTSGELTDQQCVILVDKIKKVLAEAIKAGGTTLQDFVNGHGQPGYFQQKLYVYGRDEQPCLICGTMIERCRIGQRSTFYCPECQKLE
ncbi:bifunctional DNA-formamidopyrimidine glycosylase/DNA-(apurinic or apyrimidinic site) lyase [Desulfuromonas acetoxidans]|uniref:Formamidopyrimidine-DNA glycosylase n=1 Tax=Desulfuromonas acetoxidans (strain DSM 684 / 11070) TaxID=281689 RepID=Q1K1U4_DESA6|nr:bifunctional DNA-formamidopyrimidine glycosylase/DNA-(apurinic or apyrimidinic site) lyase [Desulfuromonas acetoxidans]EAT16294.1 formamidopyrimidine-DNA glycosylase [Desulfuromonas acetoxidans DSM 684]MBF0644899.1 bifunctional DNA-formamidopyrimidine glycosylase/DNA-(apurinic or apyrimidinic site) lyase [Desulfuromonas acetoxidans]NVD25416.1 bifunctional DNA-formamidopyrimidine glycosylase/DNA-(apurinic or apyrimidinic site) lyase [Desulfuromonas acetoxidans]NVE17483.1 bifunctional DNA-form